MIRKSAQRAFFSGLLLTLISAGSLAQQSVMVVGDSISAGFQRPSYRQPLLDKLAAQDCSVDMVGNQTLNSFSFRNPTALPGSFHPGFSPSQGYDTDHQAFGGIRADEFLNGNSSTPVTVQPISVYISDFQPNYVLLHLGTNDLSSAIRGGATTNAQLNQWATQTRNEVRGIIDNIIAAHSNPADLKVLVANFIPSSSDDLNATQTLAALEGSSLYTQRLEAMVASYPSDNVIIVDVEDGFNVNTMTTDGVHPNALGEQRIADAFFDVLIAEGLCEASNGSGSGTGSGSGSTIPELTNPAPGAVLPGSSVTFNFVPNAVRVDDWFFRIGNSVGGDEFASARISNGNATSFSSSGLPTDGRDIFVQFSYKPVGANWVIRSFQYEAANNSGGGSGSGDDSGDNEDEDTGGGNNGGGDTSIPALINPAPGNTLSGAAVTFNWTANGTEIDDWYMRVGNSAGSTEYADQRIFNPSTTSLRVTGLPNDGRDIFVQFSYKLPSGAWNIRVFEFKAAGGSGGGGSDGGDTGGDGDTGDGNTGGGNTGGATIPALTNPAPGATLSGSSVTFNWTDNGTAVDDWYLRIGNSSGSTEYANQRIFNPGTTSFSVSGLPTDGRDIFVEFSYKRLSGSWNIRTFLFRAAN